MHILSADIVLISWEDNEDFKTVIHIKIGCIVKSLWPKIKLQEKRWSHNVPIYNSFEKWYFFLLHIFPTNIVLIMLKDNKDLKTIINLKLVQQLNSYGQKQRYCEMVIV